MTVGARRRGSWSILGSEATTGSGVVTSGRFPDNRMLCALRRERPDRTPVWLMRQAGRYLPEYRALRARAGDFLTLCKTPELACEATLQPLRRFPLDAAILFSDILTIPDAMGLRLQIVEGHGPRFDRPLRSEAEVRALRVPDPESDLGYVGETLRLVRRDLPPEIALIGFSGSPWTLACYMIQGQGDAEFELPRKMCYQQPAVLHHLLDCLAQAVARYLAAQAAAGAQVLMIFDSWGGVLSAEAYREFSLRYLARIVTCLRDGDAAGPPIILFSKGVGLPLKELAACGCDALGIDGTVDLGEARRQVGAKVALQGNLDPLSLFSSPDRLRQEVARILAAYGPGGGHVFNLGHGVRPDTDPEAVAVLVQAVHEFSASPESVVAEAVETSGATALSAPLD